MLYSILFTVHRCLRHLEPDSALVMSFVMHVQSTAVVGTSHMYAEVSKASNSWMCTCRILLILYKYHAAVILVASFFCLLVKWCYDFKFYLLLKYEALYPASFASIWFIIVLKLKQDASSLHASSLFEIIRFWVFSSHGDVRLSL